MAFEPLNARGKCSNLYRWQDDPLTTSTEHPRSWARHLEWAKGKMDPSELGRARPVYQSAAGLIDSRRNRHDSPAVACGVRVCPVFPLLYGAPRPF